MTKDFLAFRLLYGRVEVADFLTYVKDDQEKYKIIIDIENYHKGEISDEEWNSYVDFIKKWINEAKIAELKIKLKNTTDINEKLRINDIITKLKKGCEKNGSK